MEVDEGYGGEQRSFTDSDIEDDMDGDQEEYGA